MYEDWDDYEDEEFVEDASEKVIKRLRKNDEITDEEEGFWLGFENARA
jgi:hypothetical protein